MFVLNVFISVHTTLNYVWLRQYLLFKFVVCVYFCCWLPFFAFYFNSSLCIHAIAYWIRKKRRSENNSNGNNKRKKTKAHCKNPYAHEWVSVRSVRAVISFCIFLLFLHNFIYWLLFAIFCIKVFNDNAQCYI